MIREFSVTESTVEIPENSRYEIKLLAEGKQLAQVLSWLNLHPSAFSPTYPQRRVNNIYLDTLDLADLGANLAGISSRSKLRVRWYGSQEGAIQGAVWELKCKRSGLSWKLTHPVGNGFDLHNMTWMEILSRLRADVSFPVRSRLDSLYSPTLINRYDRRYYESLDGLVRATVDFNQVTYDQRISSTPNLTRPVSRGDEILLELKAASEFYDRLIEVVQHFPMRVTRNSKYVSGLQSSNLCL